MSKIKKIKALNEDAWACQEKNKDRAKKLAAEALKLAQQENNTNQILLARLTLTQVANFRMELEEADRHLELVSNNLKKNTPRKIVARYHHQRCYNFYQKSSFPQLIEAGHEMLKFINNDGFEKHQAWAYSTMGMAYQRLGNSKLALRSYRNAERLFRAFDDAGAVSNIRMSIGTALAELKKREEALEIFEETLNDRLSLGGGFHAGIIMANMAKVLSQMGAHTKALQHWSDAIDYLKEAGGMPLWAQAVAGRADSLRQLGRLDDAEDQLKDALSEVDKLPPPIRFDLYLALSRIYAAAKSWDDCIKVLQRAAELEAEQGIGHLQWVEFHTEFHAAYRATDQLDLALHHLEKMVQFKEKHLNDTSVAKLAEWEALYQMERLKENQQKLSKKTAELEEILTRSTNEKRALLDQLASYDVLIDEMLEALPEERKDRFRRLARSARRTNMEQHSDQLVQNRISGKHPELTPAELKVCFMLVNGWTTKEMADRSGTSIKTIEKHRTSIRRKAAIPRSVSLQVYLSGIAKIA